MVEIKIEGRISADLVKYSRYNNDVLRILKNVKEYILRIKKEDMEIKNSVGNNIDDLEFELIPSLDSISIENERIIKILDEIMGHLDDENSKIYSYVNSPVHKYEETLSFFNLLSISFSAKQDLFKDLISLIPTLSDLFNYVSKVEDTIIFEKEKEEKKKVQEERIKEEEKKSEPKKPSEEEQRKPIFKDIPQKKLKGDILSKLKNKKFFSKKPTEEEPIELTEDMVAEEPINNNSNNQNQIRTPSSQELQNITYSLQMFNYIDNYYRNDKQYYSVKIVEDYIKLLSYVENSLPNLDYMYDKYKKLNPNFYSFLVKFAREYNLIKQKYNLLLHLYQNKTSFVNYPIQTLVSIYLNIADITKILFEGKDKLFKDFNPNFLTVKIIEVKFNNLKLKDSKKVLSLIDKGSYDLKQIESYPILKNDVIYYLENFAPKNNYLNYNGGGNSGNDSLNNNSNFNSKSQEFIYNTSYNSDNSLNVLDIEKIIYPLNQYFVLFLYHINNGNIINHKDILEVLNFMGLNSKHFDLIKKFVNSNKDKYDLRFLKFYENYIFNSDKILELKKSESNFGYILEILFAGIINFNEEKSNNNDEVKPNIVNNRFGNKLSEDEGRKKLFGNLFNVLNGRKQQLSDKENSLKTLSQQNLELDKNFNAMVEGFNFNYSNLMKSLITFKDISNQKKADAYVSFIDFLNYYEKNLDSLISYLSKNNQKDLIKIVKNYQKNKIKIIHHSNNIKELLSINSSELELLSALNIIHSNLFN